MNSYCEFTLGELVDACETNCSTSACDGDNHEVMMGADGDE